MEPDFRAESNIWNVLRANAIPIVMTCGMTFVILSRGIDLSVGAMLALVSMFLGEAIIAGWPAVLAVLAAIGAGLGLGLVNGLLIGKARINFFVVTLGTMIIYRSASFLIEEGNTLTLFGRENFDFATWLGDGNVGSVPVPAIVAAIVFVVSYAVLRWTVFGRSVYAIGGNPDAARLAGIPVERVTVAVYALCGLLVGLAAVMFTGRIQSATPQVGNGLELQVIAAVLLGGVSFTGGRGSIVGAVVGALLTRGHQQRPRPARRLVLLAGHRHRRDPHLRGLAGPFSQDDLMGGGPFLQLSGIQKHFGVVHALREANFEVERGEIHALVGENGSGKTTLMRILIGDITADEGEMRFDGASTRWPPRGGASVRASDSSIKSPTSRPI